MSFYGQPMMKNMAMSYGDMEMSQKRAPEFQLPAPLTATALMQCMQELPNGTAMAVESCIECFKNKRMSSGDLISFMRSITAQSTSLRKLFTPQAQPQCEVASDKDLADLRVLAGLDAPASKSAHDQGEMASMDDMAELMALAGQHRSAIPSTRPAPSMSAHQPATPRAEPQVQPQVHAPATKAASAPRVRRKVTEPSDEEKRLMKWWSERRVPEVRRRQNESAHCNQSMTEAQKTSAYLQFAMEELSVSLPAAGKKQLLQLLQAHNQGTCSAEDLGAAIKELVNEHNVVVSLVHDPECVTRAPKAPKNSTVKVAAPLEDEAGYFGMGNDDEDLLASGIKPVKFEEVADAVPAKRKRTETLNGAEPRNEEDEDNATCPVCVGNSQDDDRWVKCDGCNSWYHQICVLFNEMAHGKSVRFFCRTPRCRKRGSRQLNRRQRKPCYPSSPQIDGTQLGDYLTQYVAAFSRQDRDVQVKLVANASSTRQVKGIKGRKVEETVQSKTIMAFQHTMIGSDLLFFSMCFDEVRSSEGLGWVEITNIDSNGLYEELSAGEMAGVEAAIMRGYLQHAKDAGFINARVHVQSCDDAETSMFYNRPSQSGWNNLDLAVSACIEYLNIAQNNGVVLSHEQQLGESQDEIILNALLNSDSKPISEEKDAERPCPVVCSRRELYSMMQQNNYRFSSLQFAKFSSMMIVYHVIKGWKKDQTATSGAKPMQAITVPDDDMMHDEAPSPEWAPVNKKQKVDTKPTPLPMEAEYVPLMARETSSDFPAPSLSRGVSDSFQSNERTIFSTADDMFLETLGCDPQMPSLEQEDTYWDNFLGMLSH
mmetsp:Transcript_11620/g.18237  ORF Transcript_11620/g.18237 Transcript_11620/m.18237 type:complete len:824 (+) Transcript_11620:189-2660(+)|eukprot:CAMPEP_0184310612 /NCGR_PEP_ID=MMETSP1049-20130417/31951_1 /TAXON_ID=77928 /ORGANISM="Proteomonas sulcata, Strain CCMP704" /LENGTH=823 /DNA_ID=CAMNT_0026624989 /DNA_START=189 /DNA_END=2660 /DNA_ORIENTATION=+